jgi:hypothetical protein
MREMRNRSAPPPNERSHERIRNHSGSVDSNNRTGSSSSVTTISNNGRQRCSWITFAVIGVVVTVATIAALAVVVVELAKRAETRGIVGKLIFVFVFSDNLHNDNMRVTKVLSGTFYYELHVTQRKSITILTKL